MPPVKHPMVKLGGYSVEAEWETRMPRMLQRLWAVLGASPAGRVGAVVCLIAIAALSVAAPKVSVLSTVLAGCLLGPAAAPEIRKYDKSVHGSLVSSIFASMVVGGYLGLMVWFATTTIHLGLQVLG